MESTAGKMHLDYLSSRHSVYIFKIHDDGYSFLDHLLLFKKLE